MFLPGIGALQLVLVLPKPSPMLVLDTFLAGIGPPKIMRKALDIRSGMIQITVKTRHAECANSLPQMKRTPRRDTELAAVEGRFQVYHPKLPTPSPMLVLDTFLPGIGASRVKHHVTRKDACAIIMKICVMTQRGQATIMVVHPLFY